MRTLRNKPRSKRKYHLRNNFKVLVYLDRISKKHGIDSKIFFNSFVEAWKQGKSTCESLLIECRKKTKNDSIFLITKKNKVVAQFPIPQGILEGENPLKGFTSARGKSTERVSKIEASWIAQAENLRIMDLKPGMKRIDLKAKVLEIPKPRSVFTRFGGLTVVTNVIIEDETGSIQLPLWNKQIDAVSVGDTIRVENAHVVTFRGERQLRIGRRGHLNVIDKE